MERLLTLREAAELLQINERTALRLAHKGELPAARIGGQWRIHPAELERWFLSARTSPSSTVNNDFEGNRPGAWLSMPDPEVSRAALKCSILNSSKIVAGMSVKETGADEI